jgi:hypothetical protein
MEFGHGPEIDREREYDLLAFSQAEIGGLDKDPGGAQIHRLAKLSASAGYGDIDDGSSPVPRVQAAFHF